MNKMEILKKAFEKIGYKTRISHRDEDYVLLIEGTQNRDGYEYEFWFNENFEPTLYNEESQDNLPLDIFYQKSSVFEED